MSVGSPNRKVAEIGISLAKRFRRPDSYADLLQRRRHLRDHLTSQRNAQQTRDFGRIDAFDAGLEAVDFEDKRVARWVDTVSDVDDSFDFRELRCDLSGGRDQCRRVVAKELD